MSATIVGSATKREGSCAIRSSKGMPILDETYYFLVVCTAKDEPYVSVLNATGLPYVGVTVSPSGYGVCRSKSATRSTDNPLYWDVQCDFSSEVEERSDNQDPATDPTTWVPIYETKFERLSETVTKDLAGTSIANSAGQPFPQGLTISRFIPVWEFYQIETPISDETLIARNETINSGSFKGRAAKSLLLTVMSSQVGYYYGAKRRLTQYSLKYNSRLWTHKRLDIGTIYLSGGDRLPYLDDGDPQRVINGGLNGSGAQVSAGSPPATLTFEMYTQDSFSFLRV